MTPIPIFFCERTGERLFHRDYHCKDCDHRMTLHSSLEEYEAEFDDVPRHACDICSAELRCTVKGYKEVFRRTDTGEILYFLPPGAVYEHTGWSDDGKPHNWRTTKADGKDYFVSRPNEQDGRVLAAVCPDGRHWIVDARASNCTMKGDDAHWCWIRHGRPEDGTLHVDKNGHTCQAGAGSIDTGNFHGFLHNGQFRAC